MKLSAVEQRAIALLVDAAVGRHVRHDALRFALRGLLSIGVARIGHHVQRFRLAHRLFAASAIGSRLRLSVASVVTCCATITPRSASTAVCTL